LIKIVEHVFAHADYHWQRESNVKRHILNRIYTSDKRSYSKSKLELNSKKVETRVIQSFFFCVYVFHFCTEAQVWVLSDCVRVELWNNLQLTGKFHSGWTETQVCFKNKVEKQFYRLHVEVYRKRLAASECRTWFLAIASPVRYPTPTLGAGVAWCSTSLVRVDMISNPIRSHFCWIPRADKSLWRLSSVFTIPTLCAFLFFIRSHP